MLTLTLLLPVLFFGAIVSLDFPTGVSVTLDTDEKGWFDKLKTAITSHVDARSKELTASHEAALKPIEAGRDALREYLVGDVLRMEGIMTAELDAEKRRKWLGALQDAPLAEFHADLLSRFTVAKKQTSHESPEGEAKFDFLEEDEPAAA